MASVGPTPVTGYVTAFALRLDGEDVVENEIDVQQVSSPIIEQTHYDKIVETAEKSGQVFNTTQRPILLPSTSEKDEVQSTSEASYIGDLDNYKFPGCLEYNSHLQSKPAGVFVTFQMERIFEDGKLYGIFFENTRKRILIQYSTKLTFNKLDYKTELSFGDQTSKWAILSAPPTQMAIESVCEIVAVHLNGRGRVMMSVPDSQLPLTIATLESHTSDPGKEVFSSED